MNKIYTEVVDGKKWFSMLAVSMSVFMSTLDASIINVSLPILVQELNTTYGIELPLQ